MAFVGELTDSPCRRERWPGARWERKSSTAARTVESLRGTCEPGSAKYAGSSIAAAAWIAAASASARSRLRSMCIWVTVARVKTRAIATAASTMESTRVLPASGGSLGDERRSESVPPRSMSPSEPVDRRDRIGADGNGGRDPVDYQIRKERKGDEIGRASCRRGLGAGDRRRAVHG